MLPANESRPGASSLRTSQQEIAMKQDRLFRAPGVAVAAFTFALTALQAQADTKTATPPAPPVPSEPQNTAATYGDWTVRCQRANDSAPRICELQQALQVQTQQGQATTIAQIVVGRLSPKDPLKLIVTVLPSVSFPSSLKMAIDEKDTQPVDLPWLKCTPSGCIATADFKDDDIKRWKTQTAGGQIRFKDATGRDQVWRFSFAGFAQALDGLSKMST